MLARKLSLGRLFQPERPGVLETAILVPKLHRDYPYLLLLERYE